MTRINTHAQAYGADELQSILIRFLENHCPETAVAGLNMIMAMSPEDTNKMFGAVLRSSPGVK